MSDFDLLVKTIEDTNEYEIHETVRLTMPIDWSLEDLESIEVEE